MEPFIYLADYPVVICKLCRFGYVADEAENHMRGQHNISIAERRKIKQVFAISVSIPDSRARPVCRASKAGWFGV
jgi:rubredoxin